MNDDQKRRIADELLKFGRVSEMVALEECVRRKWWCEASVGYQDKDQDISREIDLNASFGVARAVEPGRSVQVTIRIVGEVKKSEKSTWVVLRDHSFGKTDLVDAWNNLTCELNLPDDRFAVAKALSRYSLLDTVGWRGRGIHEAFNDKHTPYAAFVSACKAAESALEAEEATLEAGSVASRDSIFLTLIKPVVILDGPLAAATLGIHGAVDVSAIDGAPVRFQFRTAKYTRNNYNVDVVRSQWLPSYLELCEQRAANVVEALAALVKRE